MPRSTQMLPKTKKITSKRQHQLKNVNLVPFSVACVHNNLKSGHTTSLIVKKTWLKMFIF